MIGESRVGSNAISVSFDSRARLDRLDQRDIARARDMALLRETLLAFVRLWLTYAGPLDFDPEDTSAEHRFDAFLDEVVRGLKAG